MADDLLEAAERALGIGADERDPVKAACVALA